MAENNEAGSSSAPASGKNPLVALLLVLNMIAMGVVAFFQYRFMQMEAARPDLTQLLREKDAPLNPEAEGEQKTNDVVKKENLLPLETFTVNLLQGDGPRRFARMDAVLKMSDEAKPAEFEARKPQIRDTIISVLNTKRPEDLLKKEGKQFLKEEIKAAINAFLVDGKVEDVYYIGFQIN
ncbi:MAG: flagellar basal body-associated protein FliL [Bacteriovoracia bacterium]